MSECRGARAFIALRLLAIGWLATRIVAIPEAVRAETLPLSKVLQSVDRSHPEIEMALQGVFRAEGEALAARGGFDPTVHADAKWKVKSFNDSHVVDVVLEQATPVWGTRVYGGWRLGRGNLAVYDGGLETLSAGEVYGGVDIPIWRGGPIDSIRAAIKQGSLGIDLARFEQRARRVELYQTAKRLYFGWIASGMMLSIHRALLNIAEVRGEAIDEMVALGSQPAIDAVDNRRAVLSRQARLVDAERAFQSASFALSLVYRDAAGKPVVVDVSQLPVSFPPVNADFGSFSGWAKEALARRPELGAAERSKEQAEVSRDLAENQVAPDVRVQAFVAKDLGAGSETKRPLELGVGAKARWALPLRAERGRASAARARLRATEEKLRMLRDAVIASVGRAWAAMEAASQRVVMLEEQLDLAKQVSEAERERFREGSSNLLNVNLRETSEAETASARVQAYADFHQAKADLHAAVGRL